MLATVSRLQRHSPAFAKGRENEDTNERGGTVNLRSTGTILFRKPYGRSGFCAAVHSSSDGGEFQKRFAVGVAGEWEGWEGEASGG